MDHDYRLMRDQLSVVIGTADTELLGPNEKRMAIYISAPATNRFTLSIKGPAILDQGITIYPGQAPFYLTYERIGQAIREGIQAISSGAAQNVNIWDIFRL